MLRRVFSVTVVAAVMLAAGVVGRAGALDDARAEAIAELRALTQQTQDAEMRSDHLQGQIEVAEHDTADRAAVLEVRPAFLQEVASLSAAIDGAAGKVDTAAHRASAQSAQQSVLSETSDPAVVVAATATLHALTEKVGEEVSTWQAAQYSRPAGPAWSSSGPDGYARVRAALDTVGGAGVGLYESSSCAGGTAAACANSNGYIKYRADITGWSTSRLNWAMAHELAHIYQFRVWGTLNASSTYGALFGGDPEFLANCMAVVRGYSGSVGCDGEQQAWASGIWVGVVR
ncbi:hypothetical protein [Microbacterium sp. 1.5R]|uniref:hypothetical protein n=1 Tax=Microbacterium sp. 1.5R TaxID=1916917 RepID=UPI0011A33BF8|nr:hypothetical protein [Microbacterium sp. 1.5R]